MGVAAPLEISPPSLSRARGPLSFPTTSHNQSLGLAVDLGRLLAGPRRFPRPPRCLPWKPAPFNEAESTTRPVLSVTRDEGRARPQVVRCSRGGRGEVPVVEGGSMDEIYDALASRLLPVASVASDPHSKYIVALAGPPGGGKSSVASEVVRRVNKLWPQRASSFDSQVAPTDVAVVLPMDGFHLYRSQLDAMEDPAEAHARRGAPWTFNPTLLLKCLQKLRHEGSVYAPSFSHGIGDPVEDDIFVDLQHKVVIVEGNYLLLDDGVWKDLSSMFDEKWFIEVDIGTAMKRVLNRHISTGKPPDVAKWRIEYNDGPNAELVMKSKKNADLVIPSFDLQN